jgi:hypothetical protein
MDRDLPLAEEQLLMGVAACRSAFLARRPRCQGPSAAAAAAAVFHTAPSADSATTFSF